MKIRATLILAILALGAPWRAVAAQDRVRYDGQCLTVDGRDLIVFSGAFHYFRCPRELWPDRFAKIKEAGFNAVETYVPWNWHERQMPADVNDFSRVDLTELKDWLRMAQEKFGLYTIVRGGPYTCGEWEGGGFPAWLLTKRPPDLAADRAWLRTDDPTFLAWSRHWYDAVCPVIAAEQVTRKPPGQPGVILFQIENEYDYFPEASDSQRVNHLKALRRYARDDGIDVPIFTCWTKQCRGSSDPELKEIFDGSNMYPRWQMGAVIQRLRDLRRQQPIAPLMVPELQGGWFSQVGGKLSEDQDGITAPQIHHLTLLALSYDATILNYYMLFGGTNFAGWEGRTDTQSYDYNAPIREPGGVGDRYLAVKAIGLMLQEHGQQLARSKVLAADVSDVEKGVEIRVRRALGRETFIFCRNTDQQARRGTATVRIASTPPMRVSYQLGPRDFRILFLAANETDPARGQWLPKPSEPIERPPAPEPIRLASAMKHAEDPALVESRQWRDVASGQSLVAAGVYDSRYVLYRSRVTLTPDQLNQTNALWLDLMQDDDAVVSVNGHTVIARGTHHGAPVFGLDGALKEGINDIVALYENKGRPNFGGHAALEAVSGIRSAMLIDAKQLGIPLTTWRVQLVKSGDGAELVQPDVAGADWPSFDLDEAMISRLAEPAMPEGFATPQDRAARTLFGHRRRAVFRATVDLSDADLRAGRTRLTFESLADGARVFVNGVEIRTSRSGQRSVTLDAAGALKTGRNTVAAIIDNTHGGSAGLLGAVYLEGENLRGTALNWQLDSDLPGVTQGWWQPDLAESNAWQTVELDTHKTIEHKGGLATMPAGKPDALATWYRMEFELPPPATGVWVPWRATLDASGNGFVYVNGHNLGRYWEIGPQRDYYVPECWLKFGPGEKNVLAVCLCSTERGSSLRAAEISPYAEQAERRPAGEIRMSKPE